MSTCRMRHPVSSAAGLSASAPARRCATGALLIPLRLPIYCRSPTIQGVVAGLRSLVGGGLQVEVRLELEEAGEEAVDERRRLVRGQVTGQQHRLAERHPVRHVTAPEQFVRAYAQ